MQFRLQTLLLLFVVLWTSLAVFGGPGIAVFLIVLAMAAVLNGQTPGFGFLIVPVLLFAAIVVLMVPAIREAREVARGMSCEGQLCQFDLALLNYAQVYGRFPPACTHDKSGRPMHSWRVLILPFLDNDPLYKTYNLNEPWDGPNNKKLLASRPSIYSCRSDDVSARDGVTTNYVAVVGKSAFWQTGETRSEKELGDRASTTVMLVETADSDIKWTEPRDFSLDDLRADGTTSSHVKLSTRHFRSMGSFFFHDTAAFGSHVAFPDGSYHYLPVSAIASAKLKGLLSVGGYDGASVDALRMEVSRSINWPNCCALAVWIASVGLLLYRARRSRKLREPQSVEP